MAVTVARGPARRAGLGVVALWLVALACPGIAAAAGPTVGAPTAIATFLQHIVFHATADLTADVVRVELVLDVEGSTRSEVSDVTPASTSGPTSLDYTLDTPGGDLLPNTDVTARFRLTLKDGSEVVGPPTTIHYDDTRFAWNIVTGTAVRVHYTTGGTSFGQRAASIGDDAVASISRLLGVNETKPIDFYVYADQQAFYDVLGPATRENVGGEAHPEIRTLFANIDPSSVNDPWVGIVIPHELTHLVFDTAVSNPYHYPPRWLNEGLAVYLSQGYDDADRSAVAAAVRSGTLMPLSSLDGQFPTTEDRFRLAYSESVSALSFLVDRYGRPALVRLVRSYAGGVSDDEAFRTGLGTDVAGFEAAWLASLGARTPVPIGPQAAPAGPLPPGWTGAAPVPGEVANPTGSAAPLATGGSGAGPDTGASPSDTGVAFGLTLIAGAVIVIAAGLRRRQVVARTGPSVGPGARAGGIIGTEPGGTIRAEPDPGDGPASEPTATSVPAPSWIVDAAAPTEPSSTEPFQTAPAAPEPHVAEPEPPARDGPSG